MQSATTSDARRRPPRRLLIGIAVGSLIASLVLAFTASAQAAVLFSDNFEDGNADGWTKSGGTWTVVTDGSSAYQQSSTSSDARALGGSSDGTATTVSARVKPISFNGSNRFAALLGHAQNVTNYYYLAVRSNNTLELGKRVGGGYTTLASAALTVSTGTWYTLTLSIASGQLTGSVAGGPVLTATDATFSQGKVGLGTYNTSASFDDVSLANVVVAPTTTSPTSVPTSATPTISPTATGGPAPSGTADGFASVNAWGQNGTTGGAGGPSVTVSTAADFIDYATRTGPYIIWVNGMITLSAMQNVASDKTIIGVGSTSGFTGYGLTIGLTIDDAVTTPPANAVKNIIIRNLVFTGSGDDAINVQMFSHHVWIDHNDLCCGYDGLVDIKRGSSYITVSWNHTHNHTKNMLLGHDDDNAAQDVGYLKVSYHHNWFDRTPQRNPRVRFGEPVHVYNNYYVYNTDVGVACQADAGCMVEGNYFEDVEEPVLNDYAGPSGRCVARNNVFVGESGSPVCSGTVQEPSLYYSYTLDDPNQIKTLVVAGAGTGKIGG